VSASPEILTFPSSASTDQFVILASDGIWDVMSSQEAVTFVHTMMRGGVGALPKGGAKVRSEQNARDRRRAWPVDSGTPAQHYLYLTIIFPFLSPSLLTAAGPGNQASDASDKRLDELHER